MPLRKRAGPNTEPPPLLLTHIRQLLTLRGPEGPRRGPALNELGIIEDAAVLCAGGKIVSVGTMRDAARDSWLKTHKRRVREIDCRGRVVLPGLVDSHTHPVFADPRLIDFEKRIAGATYEEIAQAGGGIVSSMAAVRRATQAALAENVLQALNQMAAQGTTTVEAKSGYGLSVEAELKSLAAIRDAARRWPGTVISTLLGAHVVPPEYRERRGEYVRLICDKMIPAAAAASMRLAEFVDVFCERGAFGAGEAEQIFASAQQHGMGIRVHVCQLSPAGVGSVMRFEPASLDHLDCVQENDLALIAGSRTIATLLPGANYFLGLNNYPPARRLIDAGVAVALATDYNPGTSPTPSMPFVLSLACTHMQMSPGEAIAAATINGAHALRLGARKGSVEPGKDADLAIFEVEDYREIPYWFAANRCTAVIMSGNVSVEL